MANSVEPDETTLYSSGSTMFAQIFVLVCRAKKVKSCQTNIYEYVPVLKPIPYAFIRIMLI